MVWSNFTNEAKNAPVSFAGGVIALLGLLYSAYVFILNGNFPVIDFGGNVLKLIILIVVEAPLAYFFIHLHINIARRGHGLPVVANLLSICLSALVTCFNVSVLSYSDMLQGSAFYFNSMVVISLALAIYLLSIELLFRPKRISGHLSWFYILSSMYLVCFLFTAYSVFPDVYQKACEARISNGESWEELEDYLNNCDDYIDEPKALYLKYGHLSAYE